MPSVRGCAIALALLVADAAAHFPRAVSGDGYLAVPVGTVEKKTDKSKLKRQSFHEAVLENKGFYYAAQLGFGNPPQNVSVLVDTGSSQLWINPDCDQAFTIDQYRDCEESGHYDPLNSETPPIGPFGRDVLQYGDPSDESTLTGATLRYYADDVWFGGVKIVNQTFGVAVRSSGISEAIFGLGPDLDSGFDGTDPHSLVLHTMAEQGLIAGRIFALDLRHAEADTGALIYGGVDRSKFIGTLQTLPIVMGLQGAIRLTVTLDTIGVTLGEDSSTWELSNDETNVLLDSGSTLSRLHYDVAYPLLEALGAEDSGDGYFFTSCDARSVSGSVDFGFGDKTVRVPFSDFIIDLGDPNTCYIGVALTSEQQILGDTVLRAGYFVFDWDNQEVHVGQAANCGEPDIVAVGSGKASVAEITGNCEAEDAIFTGTGSAPTRTREHSLPTEGYTKTYTITSCPPFEQGCEAGMVTTETVGPVKPTVTVTVGAGGSNTSNNDDDEDDEKDAGIRPQALTALFFLAGLASLGWNLL